MNTSKNNGIDMKRLNNSLSRRRLLQILGGAGAGLAATTLLNAAPQKAKVPALPRLKSRLADSSPTVAWTDTLPGFSAPTRKGWYGQGMVFALGLTSSVPPFPVMLQAFNIHSASLGNLMNIPELPGPIGDLTFSNGIFYTPMEDRSSPSGYSLLACAAGASASYPQAGAVPFGAQPLSNLATFNEQVAWVDVQNNLCLASFSLNPTYQKPSPDGPFQTIPLGDAYSFAALDGCNPSQVAVAAGANAYVYDITTTPPTRRSSVSLKDTTPKAVVATPAQWYSIGGASIEAFDWDSTGASNWFYQNGSSISVPVLHNGYVYFVDDSGNFTCLDARSGAFVWSSKFPGSRDPSTETLFVEDGIAYWSTAAGILCATDLTVDPSGDHYVLTQTLTNSQGTAGVGTCIGVENGVCLMLWVAPGDNSTYLSGVDMAGQFHQFSASCSMMPDTVVGEPGNYQNSTPCYHAVLGLKDPQGNPRSNISVQLTAYEDVTISDEATTYPCQANKPIYLTTDAAGYISISIQADNLGCPALSLWASFMDRDEAMLIYPDNGLAEKIYNLQAGDLSSGLAYDNQPILVNNANAGDVANFLQTCIKQGLGGLSSETQGALTAKSVAYASQQSQRKGRQGRARVLQTASDPNTYISFPSTNTSLLYQFPAAAPTTRGYDTKTAKSFLLELAADGTSFKYANLPSLSQPNLGSASSDWDAFKSAIIKGANSVVKVVVAAFGPLLSYGITDDKGNPYTLVIQCLEDAYNAIAGILKKVFNGIHSFIEFLAQFHWSDVLSAKDAIKSAFCSNIASYIPKITSDVNGWTAKVHTKFVNVETDVATYFAAIQQQLGATTMAGASASAGGSSDAGGQDLSTLFKVVGKIDSFSPAMKIYNKVMQHIHLASFANDTNTLAGSHDTVCATVTLDQVVSQLTAQIDQATSALGDDATQAFNDMVNIMKTFQQNLANGQQLSAAKLADILGWLSNLIVNILKAVDTCIEFVLNMIPILLQAFYWFITQPINIPVFSTLYKAISDAPLSIIDLICLLIAVPASLITKAAGIPVGALGAVNQFHIYWGIATVFGCFIDAACDADSDNQATSFKSYLDWAFPATAFFMSIPNLSPGADADIYFSLQLLSWIPPFASLVIAKYVTKPLTPNMDRVMKALPYFNTAYGVMMLYLAVRFAKDDPSNFGEPMTLIGNVVACYPYIGKPLVNFGEEAQAAEVVADVFCPCLATSLGIAQAAKS